jgi:hypothetical protein
MPDHCFDAEAHSQDWFFSGGQSGKHLSGLLLKIQIGDGARRL